MSLLTEQMDSFVMLDRTTASDGYGGFTSSYTEGAHFKAAASVDTSIEARVAAVQGLRSIYTITTSRAVTLEYHDVIRRLSDSKIFRITSDGHDKKTPLSASLDMRVVTAEEWVLPNE